MPLTLPQPERLPDSLALSLENVSKTYRLYRRPQDRLLQSLYRSRKHLFDEHPALKPVTLTVQRGETVGIVGTNGSGKSTLLQIVCGTLTPTTGRVQAGGRISALLELGAGFNPEFTGRENVFLNGSILGLSQEEINARYDDIVRFSGLDAAHLEACVKTYSSGMFVRLAFAVAIAVEPDILVVDEALAVGDEAFQRKCFARIRQLQHQGTAILFVSHASQTIVDLCTRAIWFDAGEMMMQGAPKDVIAAYHKLIYAPVADQPALRQEMLYGGKPLLAVAPARDAAGAALATEETALPESCIAYPSHGAEIKAVKLVNRAGEKVSHMEFGEGYSFVFRVAFGQAFEDLKFAMLFKTKTGVELSGALLHATGATEAGAEVEVRFDFVCRLLPGTYFCNCGVMQQDEDGAIRFLHRLVDALQFHAIASSSEALFHGATQARGMVDMEITGQVGATGR